MAEFRGHCHCGAVRVAYTSDKEPAFRRCGCGFCRRHGGTYSTDPDGTLAVEAATGSLSHYRFGHRTADFLLCAHCGVFVAVTAEIDGRTRAVVNMAVMEPPPAFPPDIPLMDFEGESEEDRTHRRRRNWIGAVTIKEM
jgi:hypothetical protein